MIAAVRYYLTLMSRRQSALAPLLVFAAVLGMVYASDAGPPLAAAAVPAAALVPVAAWLLWLCATCESRAFADVTLVAVGSASRRLAARVVAVLAICVALTGLACIWAKVANPHPYPVTVIAQVAAMTLGSAIAGLGLGAVFAPPLRTTAGAATLAIAAVLVVSLIVRWMPPLGPLLHAYIGTRPPSGPHAALAVGQSVVVGLALTGLAHVRGRRAG
jgi:hypothetical protein